MRERALAAIALAVLAVHFHLAMEGLFFATKPSFLEQQAPWERISAVLVSASLLSAATLALSAPYWALLAALRRRCPMRLFQWLEVAIPAAILACSALILIDNFTYTLFRFGVTTLRSGGRFLYAAFFLACFVVVARGLAQRLTDAAPKSLRHLLAAAIGLWGVSICCFGAVLALRPSSQRISPADYPPSRPAGPDIFVVSADAVHASDIPGYGVRGEEISLFEVLGAGTVIFENQFTNANRTSSATPVLLSGKYATTTHKHNDVRFLSGEHAYLHLPAILRAMGYHGIQLGPTRQVDANHWNMREAFQVRGSRNVDPFGIRALSDRLGGRLRFDLRLAEIAIERVRERLRHAFGGERMARPQLAGRDVIEFADPQMLGQLDAFLAENSGPVFAQIHSMSTRHQPVTMAFQAFLAEFAEILKRHGRFQGALIVVWSDHGHSYEKFARLPLAIRFPHSVEVPNTSWNSQILDLAPTLLDYLDVAIPRWMEGRSLFRPTTRFRPIFSIDSVRKREGIEPGRGKELVLGGVAAVGVVICDRGWELDIATGRLTSGHISGHTTPCSPDTLPEAATVRRLIAQHLMSRGYLESVSSRTGE